MFTTTRATENVSLPGAAGFRSLRVFLHEELFFQDASGFLRRVEQFLEVVQRHGMLVMLVLFDACWRPDLDFEALPGVHNSCWVQCPSHHLLQDFAQRKPSALQRLQHYVSSVVGHFARDRRVLAWDIYNEPTQRQSEHLIWPRLAALKGWSSYPEHWLLDGAKLEIVMALLDQAFQWARAASPSQPLTTAIWEFPLQEDDEDVKDFKAPFITFLRFYSDSKSV